MPIPKKAINETLLSQLGELLSFPCYFFLFHFMTRNYRSAFLSFHQESSGRLLQLQALLGQGQGPWIKISGSPSIFNFAVWLNSLPMRVSPVHLPSLDMLCPLHSLRPPLLTPLLRKDFDPRLVSRESTYLMFRRIGFSEKPNREFCVCLLQ